MKLWDALWNLIFLQLICVNFCILVSVAWEVIDVRGFGDSRKKFQAGVAFSCRRLMTEEAICKPSFRPHLDR